MAGGSESPTGFTDGAQSADDPKNLMPRGALNIVHTLRPSRSRHSDVPTRHSGRGATETLVLPKGAFSGVWPSGDGHSCVPGSPPGSGLG